MLPAVCLCVCVCVIEILCVNPLYLCPVSVISMEVTYVLGGLVFAWIVEEWVWDYAITVTLLHIAMTVAGLHTHTHTHKYGPC